MIAVPFKLAQCPHCAREIRAQAHYEFEQAAEPDLDLAALPTTLPGSTKLVGVTVPAHSCLPNQQVVRPTLFNPTGLRPLADSTVHSYPDQNGN